MGAPPVITDSRVWYMGVVALIALQRLGELVVSRRHLRVLRARGAYEVGRDHYPWMVAMHTAFLISCALEPWLADRRFSLLVGGPALVVLVAAQALRFWTIATLGERWTTHVMVVPGEPLTTAGPYRWMRHPVYLAVVAEIASIPLLYSAWITAAVFSLLNLGMLGVRISVENEALYDGGEGR